MLSLEPLRIALESWRLALEPLRIVMEPWRLTMEPWRLALELWSLSLEPWRLTWNQVLSFLGHNVIKNEFKICCLSG
jgi:hypothetical protein